MRKFRLRVITLFSLAFLFIFHLSAYADAGKGELFGYRLGDKYPVTSKTVIQYGPSDFAPTTRVFIVTAERPVKPSEIGNVYLMVSRKSYTIIEIYAHTQFASETQKQAFAKKYAEILQAQYPGQLFETGTHGYYATIWFGPKHDKYRLTVNVERFNMSPPFSTGLAQIKLTYVNDIDGVFNLAEKEYADFMREDVSRRGLNKGSSGSRVVKLRG